MPVIISIGILADHLWVLRAEQAPSAQTGLPTKIQVTQNVLTTFVVFLTLSS